MAVAPPEPHFPPGDYDVVVVGSGPGGLQTSYCLSRLGIAHAVLSADDGPGGMFRRFPLFERLISWTHATADVPFESREYEAHDQNSLVADEPELRALISRHVAESHRRPAREEMAAGLRSRKLGSGPQCCTRCSAGTSRHRAAAVVADSIA